MTKIRIYFAYALIRFVRLFGRNLDRSIRLGLWMQRWLFPNCCWAGFAMYVYNVDPPDLETIEDDAGGRECYRDRACEQCWCGKFGPHWGTEGRKS